MTTFYLNAPALRRPHAGLRVPPSHPLACVPCSLGFLLASLVGAGPLHGAVSSHAVTDESVPLTLEPIQGVHSETSKSLEFHS